MAKRKNGLVTTLGVLGSFISIGCVIVGFVQSVQIIVDQWGVPMAGVSVLVFPATFAIMP